MSESNTKQKSTQPKTNLNLTINVTEHFAMIATKLVKL